MAAKPLIVFELANNHGGSVERGLEIIEAFAGVASGYREWFDFGFKLQYRDLDTYIHPTAEYEGYVKRFVDTRLSRGEFTQLVAAIRRNRFKAICTPFDEASVERILVEDSFDAVKIASASLGDWPLMEAIAAAALKAKLPVIASTGGASLRKIETAVAFFTRRGIALTLLHCVAEYPTPDYRLGLRQIEELRRFGLPVGFSTHERPDCVDSLGLALALGATVIEKHVGLPPVNAYSASTEQVARWLDSGRNALAMLGAERTTTAQEQTALAQLRRGIYARRAVPKGQALTQADVCFAFPAATGQLTANDWSKYHTHTAATAIGEDAPVMRSNVDSANLYERIQSITAKVNELIAKSGVSAPNGHDRALEISHHYGIEDFENHGIAMLTVVNRDYCKKILMMLPGQKHPEQYHKRKEETFAVLYGEISLALDGEARVVRKGDVVTIAPGVRHAFSSSEGAVLEEISSHHDADDSFYTDEVINENANRKTHVTYWRQQ